MVLVCPQWDAIETAFPGPETPLLLDSTSLTLTLHLSCISQGDDGATVSEANPSVAVYARHPVTNPALPGNIIIGESRVWASVFRDQPDYPNHSRRFRLRLLESIDQGTCVVGKSLCYCMRSPRQAIEELLRQNAADGFILNPIAGSPTARVRLYLKGVTRGATMRAPSWWRAFVAIWGFEPVDVPALPEGFVIGRDSVQANCLLERPDDPEDACLCRLSPLFVRDGLASCQGEPVFYRSTIC